MTPRALPPFLISILQPCLEVGATHVEIGHDEIVLFRGAEALGSAPAPPGGFPAIVEMLRSFSEADSMDGGVERRKAVFHSPAGPLPAELEIHEDRVRLVLSQDERVTEVEHVVNLALAEAARQGAERVGFASRGMALWKDGELVGVAEFDAALLPPLVTYARKLGGIADGERKGTAVVMGEGSARTLTIEIVEWDGEDTVLLTTSD
jgi:hypothetical protein